MGSRLRRTSGQGTLAAFQERPPQTHIRLADIRQSPLGPDRICGSDSGPLHAILVLFLQGVYRSSGRHAWFYGLLCFEVVFSLITGSYLMYRMVKHPAPTTTASLTAGRRRAGGAGGLGILARSGAVFAQLFIVLAAALSYGLWMAALLRSLSAVLPPERQARQRMAERLRARGYDVSVS
jgi:hypothetical protein